MLSLFQTKNFDKIDELNKRRDLVIDTINDVIKNRIKILKKTQKGSKVSITYIDMLTETKNHEPRPAAQVGVGQLGPLAQPHKLNQEVDAVLSRDNLYGQVDALGVH